MDTTKLERIEELQEMKKEFILNESIFNDKNPSWIEVAEVVNEAESRWNETEEGKELKSLTDNQGDFIVYKVQYHVNKRTPRSKHNTWERVEDQSEVILNDLETAKAKFEHFKNKCELFRQYSKYFGACSLFIPKIHDNGELAYFPYDERTYIKRIEF